MNLVLKEVLTEKELKSFVTFPDELYKKCEYYIPQIHKTQFATLSKKTNPAFEHCEAKYWLAISEGKIVGRIAGIINHRYNSETGKKLIRFGWVDFIENQKVLNLLIGAVEDWGKSQKMESIHGPLGFTSFDASGVLVEGFDEIPTSFGRYNYPYYDSLLKKAGYTKDVDWIEMRINVPNGLSARELKIARVIKERYRLRNVMFRNKSDVKQYAYSLFDLVNSVYKGLYGFSTLTREQIENLVKEFLPLINTDYISVIVNDNNEIVAVGLVLPSLSKALKKAGGRLFPCGVFHIKRALKHNDTIDMLIIGIKPEYRSKGVSTLIFEKIFGNIKNNGIKYVETTRELEDNKKVRQLWAAYHPREHKRARSYIKPLTN